MSEKINRMLFFGKTRKRTQTPSFFIKAFRNQGITVRAINYRKMERLWGKWLTETYVFSTFAKICSGAKIILGIGKSNQVEGYFSNRTWITLGCGGFLLTRYVPGLEKFFTNKKHLVWYHSVEECLHLIAEYLKKDEEREKISEEGYRYTHENHTYDHVVKRMLDCIEKGS